jgi:hypothetical protein
MVLLQRTPFSTRGFFNAESGPFPSLRIGMDSINRRQKATRPTNARAFMEPALRAFDRIRIPARCF